MSPGLVLFIASERCCRAVSFYGNTFNVERLANSDFLAAIIASEPIGICGFQRRRVY